MLDNIKLENFERSLFMVKPDSYKYGNEILKELRNNGLELQNVADVILSKEFLENLYNTGDDEIINLLNVSYFLGKKAIIGIAAGINCQKKLFELCGNSFDPNMCNKNSIRYKYSPIRKPILFNGHEFYINAIHRSLPQDAEREIEVYMKTYIRKFRDKDFSDER